MMHFVVELWNMKMDAETKVTVTVIWIMTHNATVT